MGAPVVVGPLDFDVTVAEIRRVILKLQYGKASGLDFVSTDLLKIIAEDTSNEVTLEVLAGLFNQCLAEGRTPNEWGSAIVTALYKKGDLEIGLVQLQIDFVAESRWKGVRGRPGRQNF